MSLPTVRSERKNLFSLLQSLPGILLLAIVFAGCAASNPSQAVGPQSPAEALPNLPATFVGTVPCADCPGIRYQLNLLPDQTFFLRLIYLERSVAPLDAGGTWSVSPDSKVLTLTISDEVPVLFSIQDRNTLRKLDIQGREIAGPLRYELHRRSTFEPIQLGIPQNVK